MKRAAQLACFLIFTVAVACVVDDCGRDERTLRTQLAAARDSLYGNNPFAEFDADEGYADFGLLLWNKRRFVRVVPVTPGLMPTNVRYVAVGDTLTLYVKTTGSGEAGE